MTRYLLAIDQGTSSTRSIIFDDSGKLCSQHQIELPQTFPHKGWVEHDAEIIWRDAVASAKIAMTLAKIPPASIAAIGISNQRETTLIWHKKTGQLIYPAIVWQDRRTAEQCQSLVSANMNEDVRERTGLLLDPYFSATKIAWLLEHVPNARIMAERGELAFGTIDSFLLWRLTGGTRHVTDITNASRTLLFNIHTQQWDEELLRLFRIPAALLPDVLDNQAEFGFTDPAIFGVAIPITGVAGDQQAAAFGQSCFKPGMIKSTYGTGCFVLLNTGDKAVNSNNRLLTTIAYRINKQTSYALEGSIFVAGAAVLWLRDTLRLMDHAQESEKLALTVDDNGGVYLVPAFTGLGAPYWDPLARGAILGLTRETNVGHIVRAALEAVCYQTRDLMQAMMKDSGITFTTLRVDGGMVKNNWLMQFLADIVDIRVERPVITEISAQGAAMLAGLGVGIFSSLDDIAKHWQCEHVFTPQMQKALREKYYRGWQQAVNRVCAN